MKTLKLLTSGTNASAGLIRAGACHSRLLPMPILRTEPWILRLGRDKAQLRGSVWYKPATGAQAATGSKAAGFSATGRDVTDSEQQHTACSSYPRLETGRAVNHLPPNMGAIAA